MTRLEIIKKEQPELYDKILHLAVNINNLPRKERRATQRKIIKMISNDRNTT